MDLRWGRGSMHMTFQDTALECSIAGVPAATVIGCLGSGMEIRLHDEYCRTFFLNAKDLLEAVLKSLKMTPDDLLASCKKKSSKKKE